MDAGTCLLKLTIRQHGTQADGNGHAQNCASLDEHGWDSLIQRCIDDDLSSLTFLVSRSVLQQNSSFFHSLLGSDFRESAENHVSITWDPATFCCLLQCICLGKLYIPCDLECLLEGILFFGVERAMVALIERIHEGGLVKWAPNLWNFAKGLGQDQVAEACVEAFAINFEDAMKKSELQNLPARFLAACMEHKQLTITSEQVLCEAMLNWLSCKKKAEPDMRPTCDVQLSSMYGTDCFGYDGSHCQEERFVDSDATIYSLFHKVKVLLLPLDYVLGILCHSCPANMFHVKATELKAYDKLFWLHEDFGGKTIQSLQAAYGDDLTLRITKYTKKLELAGCHQVTGAVLFQALLQFARQNSIEDLKAYSSVEAKVLKSQKNGMLTSDFSDPVWCRKMTLENLHDVNLRRCWRLDQGALASWLGVTCPNLKLLDISHCPQIEFTILSQISLSCKSLEKVKMSLYYKRLHVKSSVGQERLHLANHSSLRWADSMPLPGHLTSLKILSLHGRQNLKDCDLDLVAKCCSNLSAINLGGCLQLTDKGLAHLLTSLSRLNVLEAAYTAFGELSVNALLRDPVAPSQPSDVFYSFQTRHDAYIGKCILTALDLEGCSSVDNILLSRLLKKTPFLEYLNLGFMRVDDSTLLSFGGTSLKKLNLRETEVSECSVAHILVWNRQLENLNIKGCKRLAVSLGLETVVAAQDNCTSDMQKKLSLKNLAFGWGFTDSTLNFWKSALWCLESLSLGLGGRISDGYLSALYESSPQLQQLSLTFQVVSDTSLVKLLRNLPILCSLELHHCLGEVTRAIIDMMPTSLTKLCLERGVAWMTDGDVELLGSRCKVLTNISFTGCALLTPKSLNVMCEKWPGMTTLVLQECGTMTSDGGCCLFVCRALQQLTLRHSGSGLKKDFAERAHLELPLLQELCLDICDSKDGGFNSVIAYKRKSLMLLRLTRCTTLRNCFNGYARQHYKDSVFIEWVDNQECSTVINEGL